MLKKLASKSFVSGFIFGTVGLYILAMIGMAVPAIEAIVNVLAAPARLIGEYIGGPDGSTSEVVILTVFNGLLYGVLFRLISRIFKK